MTDLLPGRLSVLLSTLALLALLALPAFACPLSDLALVHAGESIEFDSATMLVSAPARLHGGQVIDDNGLYSLQTKSGAKLELEAYCLD